MTKLVRVEVVVMVGRKTVVVCVSVTVETSVTVTSEELPGRPATGVLVRGAALSVTVEVW